MKRASLVGVLLISVWGAAVLAQRPAKAPERAASSSRLSSTTSGGECPDGDGDGFTDANCGGTDCDDTNSDINPGESEACNGIDDDCNGQADEDFTVFAPDGTAHCVEGMNDGQLCQEASDCPDGLCVGELGTFLVYGDLPVGRQCTAGLGVCLRIGEVVCNQAGDAAVCNAVAGPEDPAGEGVNGPTDLTCFDRVDNDCDGLVDHGGLDENNMRVDNPACKTDELCDGFDNDNDGAVDDGFNKGDLCTVGSGPCENGGIIVCKPDGTAGCNVSPLPAGIENTPGGPRCIDGVDNDCDTFIDLADPGCQTDEKCDGKDNDGDSLIDEDFTLGADCSVGTGACAADGVTVCSPDQTGTICNAIAGVPSAEQPLAGLCGDGIDNDCDGFTDDADASCGTSNLTVQCALPFATGKPGSDCTGKHIVDVWHNGGKGSVLTTELLTLNPDGSIIEVKPTSDGNQVHFASRLDPADYKFTTQTNRQGTRHDVFAPVPMLRVTVQDQTSKAVAYCSNIPYLMVVEPNNTVLSSDLAELPVLVALPRIDPTTLVIKLDGVDLVAGLGLDPATAFPGGPYSGNVDVNGEMVTVEDLKVDSAGIAVLSSNTLSFRITGGLGCGGHIVLIEADRASDAFPVIPGSPTDECLADDLKDTGTVMVFKIEVVDPSEGEVTDGGPTRVAGSVCHGMAIAEADINGFDLDVSGQTVLPGDGESSADTYTLDFDVDVPVTNLRQAIAAGDATGSFDPGSNLLVARAMDHNFNTTFDEVTFAVGPIVPAPLALGGAAFGFTAGGTDDPPNFVHRAFVMGINTTGITTVFTAQKDSNSQCIKDRTKRKFREQEPPPRKIDVECDPEVSMTVNGAEFQKDGGTDLELDITVTVDPQPDKIDVTLALPPLDIHAHFGGYCQSDCICAFGGCLCAVCVTVDVNAIIVRKEMKLSFSVSETNILQTGIPREEREPLDFDFDLGESNPEDATHVSGEIDIGCVLGFFLDVIDFFVTVFTLGFVDIDLDIIEFELTEDDMKDRFDSLDGDPMELEFVKMKNDEEALDDFDSKQRDARLTDCQINDNGMAIAVGSAFEPREDKIDPEARQIPGTPLKNAPIPQPPIEDFLGRDASELTIAISDDVFNQLFYNMTQTGKLKTDFEHVRELRTFMPEDCDTIADESRRARCIGWNTQDCSEFPGRICSDDANNAGDACIADAGCHACAAGSPNAGSTCIADAGCGQVCSGDKAGTACTLNSQCTGECSAGSSNAGQDCLTDIACGRVCVNGSNPGASCNTDLGCFGGGTCQNSGTCDGIGTCAAIPGSCDMNGECLDINPLRRSCVIGKLLAKRFNVRPDTQMILRAKIDEAPKLLIDDDPQCPSGAAADDPCRTGPVEIKLHVSNLTIAMIADRNNNSLVDGDELTLPECNFSELNSDNLLELENEPEGTIATDCLLFRHCMKIDVNFSMGVETVNNRSRIKMDFGGIDRVNTGGYQCGGNQSLPELDFFNQEAGRDGSLDQLEGNVRDNTPKLAPEGMDLGGNVAFALDRILAIRTRAAATCVAGACNGGFNNGGSCSSNDDCDDGYQDFIGLTGHTTGTPGPNPPCPE